MGIRKVLIWLILLLGIGIISVYCFFQSTYMQKRLYPLRYEKEIVEFSKEYELDHYMVMGIIWVESKFQSEAKSNKDAMGLMQIVPTTGQWIAEQIGTLEYKEKMLYEPETNIMFGCWYFAYLLRVFNGNEDLALAAYNGGMGNVRKWLKDTRYSDDGVHLKSIPFRETSDYLKRVKDAYHQYRKLYDI